jgi:hypothetical protein
MSDEKIRAGRGVIPVIDVIFTGVLWLALAAIAGALYLLGEGAYFVLTAETVEGTVVDRTYEPGVELGYWAPVVDFTTKDGQSFRVAQEEHGSACYEKGDKLTVFYHPDDPEAARFPTYVEFFEIPVGLFVTAAFLLVFRWFGYFVLGVLGRAMLRATEGVEVPPEGEATRAEPARAEPRKAEPRKAEPAKAAPRERTPVVQRRKR